MNFKKWIEENITNIDNLESISDFSYIGFRDKSALKATYNILKNIGVLDYISVYSIKDHDYNYILAFGDELNVDSIFPIIRVLNGAYYFDKITKEQFKNIIIGANIVDDLENGNFYCLFTLNHEIYTFEYINKIEKILNENITFYTNLDTMYNEFKEAMKSEKFSAIIKTHFPDCSVMVFNNKEDIIGYKKYCKEKESSNSESYIQGFDKDIPENTLKELMNNLPNIIDNIGLGEDDEVKISLYEPKKGKIIDIAEYTKKDKNKLN